VTAAALARLVSAASSDGAGDELPLSALPASPRRVRIGMPQLDVGGLSESWLLRHAGDLHWEAISRQLGVTSDEIKGESDERLYPTVVALRARYEAPLSAVRENDVLEGGIEVLPCGGACAHGRFVATVAGARLSVELLTTFAQRDPGGAMRMALPAARLASRWRPLGVAPVLSRLARAARRGEPIDDRFAGPSLDPGRPLLGYMRYEPSPYTEYNGARLLYFASYAGIADLGERRLVRRLGLAERRSLDWALATSPVQRDVFFYGNLPLGDALVVELLSFEREGADARGDAGGGVKTRVRLRRERDGVVIADVITRRLVVRPRAAGGRAR
jgi:probable biosynthetic protein (TIGR04098 family)